MPVDAVSMSWPTDSTSFGRPLPRRAGSARRHCRITQPDARWLPLQLPIRFEIALHECADHVGAQRCDLLAVAARVADDAAFIAATGSRLWLASATRGCAFQVASGDSGRDLPVLRNNGVSWVGWFGVGELPTMITVLRRWFVPSDRLEEFTDKWRNEVMPEIRRQPGCTRVEMYESSIREHWVSAITCEDEEARLKALEVLSRHQEALAQYERFEPEILTLRSHMP